MSARRATHEVRSWLGTRGGRVAVAAALTVVCGVLVPFGPTAAATAGVLGLWSSAWLDHAVEAVLPINGAVLAVAGPWAYHRAGRALRPSVGTGCVHTARRVAAASGLAYGALATTLLLTVLVGTPTLGLLGLPMTSHVLTLVVAGPAALVVGLLSLLLTAADACTSALRRRPAPVHP